MNRQRIVTWGIATLLVMSLLSGCGGASSTPVVIVSIPTLTSLPPIPPKVLPSATTIANPATSTTGPVSGESTATAEGTVTLAPSATLEAHVDRPFLMRIDRISVIVGRGTLLEGQVANGTLQTNDNVEILSPQGNVISPTVLAILISNIGREQVTVGDYAGILVGDIKATELSPGMLLAKAGEFKSYEEALQQLQ